MFIKKIPDRERSLMLASSSINTYKKAVEELVYNTLDAESTSIAIRINIEQNSIQVIDNGCGITKKDLNLTGQRYMTSKFAYKSHSKSNKYGYRGESLANIIEVSKIVKITSRYESSDESWEKYFNKGREENMMEVVKRPSKGTTIEIRGLLYNRKIQRRAIHPLNEMQEIKIFLERISLVHYNVSLSLRDDTKNEIVFQIHKKRDIYQTLLSLYGIERSDVQELRVEKNQYSVTAHIAKEIGDIKKQWIYLNRIFVNKTSKLYKIVNDNLQKCLKNENHRKKTKIRYDNEDTYLIKNKLPFYFLFIQCPVTDYVIISNQIEFNNCDQITKLLEKMVKFYFSDINLKALTNKKNKVENLNVNINTREQVKKIMDKILASHPNVLGVSQMQNGIKGKIMKRKRIRKRNTIITSHSKLTNKQNKRLVVKSKNHIEVPKKNNVQPTISNDNKRKINDKVSKENTENKFGNANFHDKRKLKKTHESVHLDLQEDIPHVASKKSQIDLKTKPDDNIPKFINDPVVRKFIDPTESIKKLCEILPKKAKEIINKRNYKNPAAHLEQKVNYSYIEEQHKDIEAGKNAMFRNRNDEVYLKQNKNTQFKIQEGCVKSTYDLLHTILNTQTNNYIMNTDLQTAATFEKNITYCGYKADYHTSKRGNDEQIMTNLTYESHNYEITGHKNFKLKKIINANVISDKFKCNFEIPDNISKAKIYQKSYTYKAKCKEQNNIFKNAFKFYCEEPDTRDATWNIEEFSQIIQSPKSTYILNKANSIEEVNTIFSRFTLSNCHQSNNFSPMRQNACQDVCHDKEFILDKTYNLPRDQELINEHTVLLQNSTSSLQKSNRSNINIEKIMTVSSTERHCRIDNRGDDLKAIFLPDSQNSKKLKTPDFLEPINLCEAVYFSNELYEKEFEISFNNNNQKSFLDIDVNLNTVLEVVDKDIKNNNAPNQIENESHHFRSINNITNTISSNIELNNKAMLSPVADIDNAIDPAQDNLNVDQLNDINHNEKNIQINLNSFDLKNRLNFVPKGMSPIFNNCNTKHIFDHNHSMDCFEDSLYNNFANEVQAHSEIYNEDIQNQNKCKSKRDDDMSLKFDGESLKYAKVLNQVDNKFIAAIIKANGVRDEDSSHFFALFDQHAVHERIRLENNMSEYLVDNQWKSMPIEGMTILLPKDEILYLHNYKDKFAQLGLLWSLHSSNEVEITAIPEAIFGKNPRQVDKIMKAVKMLISEQISYIKSQNGCISMYPKSIMDLVFSEACRYAIMFGDKLTKEYCVELLQDLSKCKNPFQCAHGRPVMAVLTDFMYNKQYYKVNLTKLKQLKQ